MTEKNRSLPPHLTDKQERFIKKWAEYGHSEDMKVQAYIDAGYSENSPQNVNQVMKTAGVSKYVRQIMKRKGLTLEKLVEKHVGLLDAEKPIVIGRGKDSEVRMVPDNGVQMRAIMEGYKLGGFCQPPTQKIDLNKEETLKITLEDQRQAERTLLECVDAEVLEDESRDSGPESPGISPDSPLY